MSRIQKHRKWLFIGLATTVLLASCFIFLPFRAGVRVTIQNIGDQSLRSVVLHVTGGEFLLGDIAPGSVGTAKVRTTGESGLEIEFTDGKGQPQRLNLGGYFEPGYRGTIRVAIKDGVIASNEQRINIY